MSLHTSSRINPQTSPFFNLPNEIRNIIYRFTLIVPTIEIKRISTLQRKTSLLRTCSKSRTEATTIFYAENEFVTIQPGLAYQPAKAFTEYVDRRNLQLIPAIYIQSLAPSVVRTGVNMLCQLTTAGTSSQDASRTVGIEFGWQEMMDVLCKTADQAECNARDLAEMMLLSGVLNHHIDRHVLKDPEYGPGFEAFVSSAEVACANHSRSAFNEFLRGSRTSTRTIKSYGWATYRPSVDRLLGVRQQHCLRSRDVHIAHFGMSTCTDLALKTRWRGARASKLTSMMLRGIIASQHRAIETDVAAHCLCYRQRQRVRILQYRQATMRQQRAVTEILYQRSSLLWS